MRNNDQPTPTNPDGQPSNPKPNGGDSDEPKQDPANQG